MKRRLERCYEDNLPGWHGCLARLGKKPDGSCNEHEIKVFL
ncbi:MAG: hypothetical protein V2A69_05200 [Pseudomonadota bacterium]